MTLANTIALVLVLGSLAAIPSSSVALVVVRSATLGTLNGLATAAGIVAGDLIFMAIAIMGMTALAEQVGTLFVLIRYLAGAYLLWLGLSLIRNRNRSQSLADTSVSSPARGGTLAASFAAGLLLTLGDVKAIFFYASLLPTFLDLKSLTAADIAVVSIIIVVAVGGVKAVYAVGAHRVSQLTGSSKYQRPLKIVAGSLMIGAGAYLLLKS